MCLTTKSVPLPKNIIERTTKKKEKLKAELEKIKAERLKINEERDEARKKYLTLDRAFYKSSRAVQRAKDNIDYQGSDPVFLTGERTVLAKKMLSQVVRIADKDITCWKKFNIVNGLYKTPYRNYFWPKSGTCTVKRFGASISAYRSNAALDISQGLHAYTSRNGSIGDSLIAVIIPKGAKYIRSGDGTEIVALAMKIKSPIAPTTPVQLTIDK